MSVLDRFEKSVEGAVNGVFAKFGSKDLKPVDLSSALEREIDKEAMPVTRDRTVAPNEYRFKLSTPDFNNIVEWGAETLANELADGLEADDDALQEKGEPHQCHDEAYCRAPYFFTGHPGEEKVGDQRYRDERDQRVEYLLDVAEKPVEDTQSQ